MTRRRRLARGERAARPRAAARARRTSRARGRDGRAPPAGPRCASSARAAPPRQAPRRLPRPHQAQRQVPPRAAGPELRAPVHRAQPHRHPAGKVQLGPLPATRAHADQARRALPQALPLVEGGGHRGDPRRASARRCGGGFVPGGCRGRCWALCRIWQMRPLPIDTPPPRGWPAHRSATAPGPPSPRFPAPRGPDGRRRPRTRGNRAPDLRDQLPRRRRSQGSGLELAHAAGDAGAEGPARGDAEAHEVARGDRRGLAGGEAEQEDPAAGGEELQGGAAGGAADAVEDHGHGALAKRLGDAGGPVGLAVVDREGRAQAAGARDLLRPAGGADRRGAGRAGALQEQPAQPAGRRHHQHDVLWADGGLLEQRDGRPPRADRGHGDGRVEAGRDLVQRVGRGDGLGRVAAAREPEVGRPPPGRPRPDRPRRPRPRPSRRPRGRASWGARGAGRGAGRRRRGWRCRSGGRRRPRTAMRARPVPRLRDRPPPRRRAPPADRSRAAGSRARSHPAASSELEVKGRRERTFRPPGTAGIVPSGPNPVGGARCPTARRPQTRPHHRRG